MAKLTGAPGRGHAGTPAEIAGLVRNGDRVVTSGCGAAPVEFLGALAARQDLECVVISHATAWGPLPHLADTRRPPHVRFEAYFLPALARGLYRRGEVDYIPLTFAAMDGHVRQGGVNPGGI